MVKKTVKGILSDEEFLNILEEQVETLGPGQIRWDQIKALPVMKMGTEEQINNFFLSHHDAVFGRFFDDVIEGKFRSK